MDKLERLSSKARGNVKALVNQSEYVGEAAETRTIYPGFQEDERGEGFEGTAGAFLSLTKNWK